MNTHLSEERIQADCFQWFHNTYPELRGLLWHVPNGGSRNKAEGAKLKAMGVVSGVFDLHFYYKHQLYVIEMKSDTGKLSEAQKDWGGKVWKQGAMIFECRDLETFKIIIHAAISN